MENYRIIKELDMDAKRIMEGINTIEKQIEKGYIDLGLFDDAEVDIIRQAIKEFKINNNLNNIKY